MAELQERYQARYKGRKGRKRLQEICDSIDRMHSELGNRYDGYEELQFLEEKLPDPEVKLYFLKYLRDLDQMWRGTMTYGLLRLCADWVRGYQVEELSQPDVDSMLENLLPSEEWEKLTHEKAVAQQAKG